MKKSLNIKPDAQTPKNQQIADEIIERNQQNIQKVMSVDVDKFDDTTLCFIRILNANISKV